MDVFVTAHGSTGDLDDLVVNCDNCGAWAPLGLGFNADEDIIDEAAQLWGSVHTCGPAVEYGLREFPNEEKAARYFGLPNDYR